MHLSSLSSVGYSLKNGLCIAAASGKYPDGQKIQYEDTKRSIPLVVRVPSYSQVEIASCIAYYQVQNLIDPGMDTLDVVTYRMQTG